MKPVESLLIVGSGFAAWASACLLSRALGGRVSLQVVGCDGEQGVDESLGFCRPAMLGVHHAFGIGEPGFVRATGATFSLGTEMRDWHRIGAAHFQPFGAIGARLDSVPFHQVMNRVRLASRAVPRPEDCSLAATAARLGRFAHPTADRKSVSSTYDYAYQFDANLATAHLRDLAQRQGVRSRAGKLREVRVGEDGFVQSVTLDDGEQVDAQLFLDCSGARSRLLGEALGVPFDSWERWLPCDRIRQWRVPRAGQPPPFASAVALAAGWKLRLSLQSADVHVMFYSSQHGDGGTPAGESGSQVSGDVAPYASGRRRRCWSGNCIAIGAAAGSVEPVSGIATQLVYDSIARLIALFPHADCSPKLVAEYERLSALQWERARDFATLPYQLSRRDDTAFWRERGQAQMPEELEYRLRVFGDAGRLARYDDELFDEADWVGALLGHGMWPRRPDPLTLSMDLESMAQTVQRMREVMSRAANGMPTHGEYLKRLGLGEPGTKFHG